jgi:hypothetical protein
VVERDLAKVDVAGSTPVSRSRNSSWTTIKFAVRIHPDNRFAKGCSMLQQALWLVMGFSVLGTLGCGNSKLTSVSLSPAVADAQNFPNGQVQFTAYGSSRMVPLTNIAWCIGSRAGLCNGNIASAASIDNNGLAHCNNIAAGTVTILAGTGGSVVMPDGGRQLSVYGTAQLTCP